MDFLAWTVIILGGAVLGWGILIFNRLVRLRNHVRAGFSDIDVQLQLRHDLVPRLVEAVRGYAGHERGVLEEVTELRGRALNAGETRDRDAAESALAGRLSKLVLLAEDYPDLKADANFRQLMDKLVGIEDQLQHARRFYNGAVRQYNTGVQQFPDLLIARLFGFGAMDFFSADIEVRAAPVVELTGGPSAGAASTPPV